jgi:hypothetical protein
MTVVYTTVLCIILLLNKLEVHSSHLYSIPVKKRGDVNKVEQGEVLLLLPNLVPHPVSFHITVIVF